MLDNGSTHPHTINEILYNGPTHPNGFLWDHNYWTKKSNSLVLGNWGTSQCGGQFSLANINNLYAMLTMNL
jgi:hypothetical protein